MPTEENAISTIYSTFETIILSPGNFLKTSMPLKSFIFTTLMEWKWMENEWPKRYLSQSLTCEQSCTVSNERNRSGSRVRISTWNFRQVRSPISF